jgi:hypothetical protein
MLSSEARQVVLVVVAFLAGAALALVPLSSAPLLFTKTSTYPAWGFLIATVCGSCPIVWSHGRRALAQIPAPRSSLQEALGYGVSAAAFGVISLVVSWAVFRHVRPVVTLPHIQARFDIVFLAVALAVAPSIIAMARVGGATRHGDVRAADLAAWRAILQCRRSWKFLSLDR